MKQPLGQRMWEMLPQNFGDLPSPLEWKEVISGSQNPPSSLKFMKEPSSIFSLKSRNTECHQARISTSVS